MKPQRKSSNITSCISSIFMMLTLAWLTISLPFVYNAQQLAEFNMTSDADMPSGENEEETDNPLANTTEEKTPKNISSMSEEYLHDSHSADQYLSLTSLEYIVEHVFMYNPFYGELISPPPDAC